METPIKINCLVVDDDQPALEIMLNYTSRLPFLNQVKLCSDSFAALEILRKENIDLIFLDIQMPGLCGVELLKSLDKIPKVIFTTAFSEFAIDGFELGATDYLLKPFTFERLVKAVNRVLHQENTETSKPLITQTVFPKKTKYKSYLFLKADKVLHRVDIKDILFLCAWGNYTKVFTSGKVLVIHESLLGFEAILNPDSFVRIHKSYIVALSKINKIDGNRIYIKDHEIPIGDTFRTELLLRMV